MRISGWLRDVVRLAIVVHCLQWFFGWGLSLRPVPPNPCDGKVSCVSQPDGDHAEVSEDPDQKEFLERPSEERIAEGNVTLGVTDQGVGTVAPSI
jgi:hypothetical protein